MAADKVLTKEERAQFEQVIPMWKIVWGQFLEHRAAVVGLVVIIFFVLVALSAPLIKMATGLDPEKQNPLARYAKIMEKTVLPVDQREEFVVKFTASNPVAAENLKTTLKPLILEEEERAKKEAEEAAKANGGSDPTAYTIPGDTSETTAAPDEATSEEAALLQPDRDFLLELANKPLEDSRKILTEIGTSDATAFLKVVNSFETTHLVGTDELGRDVFIRLIYGTRVSLGVGVMVAISSALLGLLIGSLAGYYGGVVDMILMRVTDALLSLPILPIQIILAAVDLNKVPFFKALVGTQNEVIVKLAFILLFFSWMTTALLVRGSILTLREREFILAAKTLGARDRTIIFKHLFPNVVAPLLVSVTLGVGGSIIYESALSFLGLGIQQPTPSWGNMLFNAQDLITEAPFLAIIPGLLILAVTMSFNYLGDGLQDAIDPKAIRR